MQDDLKTVKQKLKDKSAKDLTKKINSSIDKEEVILFVSFDLVNSTSYKTRNYTSWFPVLITINKRLKEYMNNLTTNCQLWRTIGDEAIFIINIASLEQLEKSVKSVFEIVNRVVDEIKSGKILKNNIPDDDVKVFRAQNVLSLKACAWIALVHKTSDFKKRTNKVQNLMYLYNNEDGEGLPTYEFQGNDIDTGFRIKEHTRERRLALSLELAYLLSRNPYIDPKVNIITYRRLKGIWDDKMYPVIWYHDYNVANCKIGDSFFYDEYYNDEITQEYIDEKYEKVRLGSKNTSFHKLDKIITDNNIKEKVEALYDKLKNPKSGEKLIEGNPLLEVHCVAICVNLEKKKVLMFMRSENVSVYKNKWEFGCSRIQNGQSFKENLEKDYNTTFGIDIEVLDPIKEYYFDNEDGKLIPGIRFVAKVKNNPDITIIKETIERENKYLDCKYISLNELKTIDYKDKIDYIEYDQFLEAIEAVYKYFEI